MKHCVVCENLQRGADICHEFIFDGVLMGSISQRRPKTKTHSIEVPIEKAYLVALEGWSESESGMPVEHSLRELGRLVRTAGGTVVGRATQRRPKPHPAHYIGKGKIEEIVESRSILDYTMVVFDDELSPTQQLNLEKAFGVKVLDRSALILDIFAQRARTKEASLQVELAQHEYLKPRLRGQWQHLSRTVGGPGSGNTAIGTRGPGETQLETDRRLIDRRISRLRKAITGVRKHRMLQRERRLREGIPVVALVGYTNAGKSSLLKSLAGTEVFTADAPFATLDPLTRRLEVRGHDGILLTDTVGFMQKLPPQLISAFQTTLEELSTASLLVHVIDAESPVFETQISIVNDTLTSLALTDIPMLTVVNKSDLLFEKRQYESLAWDNADLPMLNSELDKLGLNLITSNENNELIYVSATEKWGINQLRNRLLYEFFGFSYEDPDQA